MPPVQIVEADVTELRAKGVDILPSMVESDNRRRSASNHPDDASATSIETDAKAKVEAETKAANEKKEREEASAQQKRDLADGKIDPATGKLKEQPGQQGAETPEAKKAAEDAKAAKQSGYDKRVGELTKKAGDAHRARVAAEQEAAHWKKQAEDAKAKLTEISGAKAPQRGDFDTEDAYLAALSVHSGKTAAQAAHAETTIATAETNAKQAEGKANAATDEGAQAAAEAWKVKQEDARSRYADYDTVTVRQDVKVAPHVAVIMLGSEMGADLLYHLGKNPAEAERLSALNPQDAAREIGRIEQSLSGTRPAAKAKAEVPGKGGKVVSDAPAPLEATKGEGDAVITDASKLSMAEYVAARSSGKLR